MKKTEQIPFRATPQERQRLDEMAATCGMTRSELIRHIVQTTRVELVTTPVPPINVNDRPKAEHELPTTA